MHVNPASIRLHKSPIARTVAPRGNVRVAGCSDWVSDALACASRELGGGTTAYNLRRGCPTPQGQPNMPYTRPDAMPVQRNGGGYCDRPAATPSYAAGLVAGVAGGASSVVTITPKVAMKPIRLVIPGGINWRVSSIQVGLQEFIAGGSVSGLAFDQEDDFSGRLNLPVIDPSLPLTITATNISGGALDLNPFIVGGIPS